MLEAFLGPEGTGDSGIGASGTSSGDGEFTDVKKYAKEPIQTERGTMHIQQNFVLGGIYCAMNNFYLIKLSC